MRLGRSLRRILLIDNKYHWVFSRYFLEKFVEPRNLAAIFRFQISEKKLEGEGIAQLRAEIHTKLALLGSQEVKKITFGVFVF